MQQGVNRFALSELGQLSQRGDGEWPLHPIGKTGGGNGAGATGEGAHPPAEVLRAQQSLKFMEGSAAEPARGTGND